MPCARDGAGNDTISRHHEATKADLTITLADVFGLLKAAQAGRSRRSPWRTGCPWTRTFSGGRPDVLRTGGGIPVAISLYGERVLRNEGTDPLFVPHGVDARSTSPGTLSRSAAPSLKSGLTRSFWA